MMKINP